MTRGDRNNERKTASDYRETYAPRGVPRGGEISEIQKAIDRLTIEGLSARAIAAQLGISEAGVYRHRDQIANWRALKALRRMA